MRRVVLALLLVACTPPTTKPSLTVIGLEPRALGTTVGVAVEWEVTFRDATGGLKEPSRVEPFGTNRVSPQDSIIEQTVLEPGRRTLKVTPLKLQQVSVGLEVWACDDCVATQHGSVDVQPDPPVDDLVSLVGTQVSLAVGEARALPALTMGTAPSGIGTARWAWPAPITLTSNDAAVVRIERGRIRGVGVGTASVVARAVGTNGSSITTSIDVTVTDAGLGAPKEGLHTPFTIAIDSNEGGSRHLQPPLFEQLKVDTLGRPVTLGVLFGSIKNRTTLWRPALVAQWTGSGFETLAIGRAGEAAVSPRLAVDETNHRYVVYRNLGGRSSPGVVLADFDASTEPEAIRYRSLPVREGDAEYADTRDVTSWLMGIGPRAGGGAWVAWVHSEGELSSGPSACVLRLRVAEVFGDQLRMQDAARLEYEHPTTCQTKHLFRADADGAGTLLVDTTRRPGLPPDLVVRGVPGFETGRLVEENGAWRFEAIFPEIPRAFRERMEPWVFFPPVTPVGDGVSGWTWWNGFTPDDGFVLWSSNGVLESSNERWPDPVVGLGEPFALQAGTRTWLGNEHPGVLLRRRGGGRYFVDDPTPRWFAGGTDGRIFSTERGRWLTQGAFSGDGRLHLTIANNQVMKYGVVDPPVQATTTSAETSGVLLQRAVDDAWAPVGLSVASSGARFVSLRRLNAELATLPIGAAHNPWFPVFLSERRLLRSSGPQQPFEVVTVAPQGVQAWAEVTEHAGATWAIGWQLGQLHVLRSTDGGRSFTSAFAQASPSPTNVLAMGRFLYAACSPISGSTHLWRFDLGTPGFAPVDLGLTVPTPLPATTSLRLLPSEGGLTVAVRSGASNLVLWRYSAAGALIENVTLAVPQGGAGLNMQTLLVEGGAVWGATDKVLIRRLAGASAFAPVKMLGTEYQSWSQTLRVRGGVLAVPLLRRTGPDCWKVALQASTDEGTSWTDQGLVREQGGCLQLPWVSTIEGGEVLLAMGDNDSLRAFELGDDIRQEGTWLFPDLDALFVRARVP